MQRNFRSILAISAACGAVTLSGAAFGQTNEPIAKDDAILGLSVSSAVKTLKHVKANFGVKDSGTVTGTAWNQTFLQSVEFDNLNGLRHNAAGNLLGLNFGVAATGGTLSVMQANGITAATPTTSTQIFAFDGVTNGTELARVGGLSVSPLNTRIAVSTNEAGPAADKRGKLIVLDYAAGPGDGTSTSVSNYRSIEIPGLRTGTASRTSSTAWYDSNNVMVVGGTTDLSSTGDLYKVTVAANGSLSSTMVASNLFQGFNLTFTNVTYEPTVSPYMFVSGSGFSGGTINKLIAVDPANNFAPVTDLLDFSPATASGTPDGQINTLRETAFDSKGNLVMGAFAGSTALSDEYVMKSLINAKNVAALASQTTALVGVLQKQQTSADVSTTNPPIIGTSSSFNGLDVAITNIDWVNADVPVNIGTGDYTQQYFGATSPLSSILTKLLNGKLVGTTAPNRGVGYAITPNADPSTGGTFRVAYTVPGDANLTKNVDFNDLVALAQNYNGTGKVWAEGDFTYDQIVDFNDLVVLAQNYNQSFSLEQLTAAGLSADFAADWRLALSMVPEPTTLAAVGGALAVAIRRRRA